MMSKKTRRQKRKVLIVFDDITADNGRGDFSVVMSRCL